MLNHKAYFDRVSVQLKEHLDWRIGQTYFNVLYEFDHELADRIRTTEFDPFFDDNKLDAFFTFLSPHFHPDSPDDYK